MTPNRTLANFSAYTNSSVRVGNLLLLNATLVLSAPTDWSMEEMTLFTLEQACRPEEERLLLRRLIAICGSGTGAYPVTRGLKVKPNGAVNYYWPSGETQDVSSFLLQGVAVLL